MRVSRGASIAIALVVILALLLTACGGTQSTASPSPSSSAKPSESAKASESPKASGQAPSGDPIKIGAILPFTGRYAPMGEPMKKTAEMAEEYINKNGGIAGRPMKLVLYDDEADQAKAAQLADKLINQDKVAVILGPVPTANAQAVAEIAERGKTVELFFNPTMSINTGKKYIFGATPNDELEIGRMIQYIKKLGKQNIGILHDANPYGTNGATVLQDAAKTAGFKITDVEKYGGEDRDVTPQLTKIKNSNPDVLAIIGVNPVPAIAAKQAKQLGMNLPILGTSAIANPDFINLAGDAADGVYSIGAVNLESPSPAAKAFIDVYKAKFNASPGTYDAFQWEGTMLAKWAIEKAGGKTDGDSIAAALESMKDYPGVLGTRTITKDNHRGLTVDSVYMQQVKGGKWALLPNN